MRKIELKEIINTDSREAWVNTSLLDSLNNEEKNIVEEKLIQSLLVNYDYLIVEALGYLKSQKALLTLIKFVYETSPVGLDRIVIANAIYQISNDDKMIDIAIDNTEKIKDKFILILAFHYLRKFHNKNTDEVIRKYINDQDFLISQNAKAALQN